MVFLQYRYCEYLVHCDWCSELNCLAAGRIMLLSLLLIGPTCAEASSAFYSLTVATLPNMDCF